MIGSLLNLTRDSILQPLGLLPFTHLFIFELLDIIIMSFAIGYIFSSFIKPQVKDNYDPLKHYKNQKWENLKFTIFAAAPAVVLHELAHKFVAMAFGAKAVLYAPYGFYLLVIILKMIGFPFLFLVGGFVRHNAQMGFPSAIVSIAGPLMNFIIWGLILFLLKKNKIPSKYTHIAVPLARISLFLGIFNMIPLPGFDGFSFFKNLFIAIF